MYKYLCFRIFFFIINQFILKNKETSLLAKFHSSICNTRIDLKILYIINKDNVAYVYTIS
jgi:hypothetical protein